MSAASEESADAATGAVKSVERSIRLLMYLTERPMTLTELTNVSGLSKTTTLRLLTTLIHCGLVARDPLTNRYQLGPACLALGSAFMNGQGGLIPLAPAEFDKLHERYPETVVVHVRIGRERVCVDEIASPNPVRYVAAVGSKAPIHIGAAGRTLLAYLEPSELDAILGTGEISLLTTGEQIDRAGFLDELKAIRTNGWALSQNERVFGAAAVSVPIFDADGAVVAALSLLGPVDRLPTDVRLEAVPALKRLSSQITTALTIIARTSAVSARATSTNSASKR